MSSRRTSEPTVAGCAIEGTTLAVLAIGVLASLLIAAYLYACADDATITISSEHGASYCPECHVGGDRK